MSNSGPTWSFKMLLTGVVAFTAAFGIAWFLFNHQGTPMLPGVDHSLGTTATVLATPMPVPEFGLTDHTGRAFVKERLKGHWTWLFFGYASCPDICPTTLATLNEVVGLPRDAPMRERPEVVFVSVDPERDSLARLARYVPYFNPAFIGVTGEETQIQALTRPIGIAWQKTPDPANTGDYLIDHSAVILLMDPGAGIRALFSPPHKPQAMAEDFRKIVAAFGKT